MEEVELDLTADTEEVLERIDIITENGLKVVRLDAFKKSKRIFVWVKKQ